MCRFITIGVENVAEAKKIFADYTVWGNTNKSFISEIPTKHKMLWVTDEQCSCAFYSIPYDPEKDAEKLKKKFSKPKYRKKWTAERIDREVKEILSRTKQNGGLNFHLFSCVQNYSINFGNCYLHVGWYDGDQTKDDIKIEDRVSVAINLSELTANDICENILYKFYKSKHNNHMQMD